MNITIEQSDLSAGIKSIQRLVGATIITCVVEGNFLKLIGANNSNAASLTVPCGKAKSKDKQDSFSIDIAMLLDSMAKRKTIGIEITDSSIIITDTKSKYKADLVTQQFEVPEIIPEDVKASKDYVPLKKAFVEAIEKWLPKLELKPLVTSYNSVPIGIKATKKGTFIGSFDFFQAAFFFDEEIKGNVEFTLPGSIFAVLYKEMKGQSYKIVPTESTVYAFNDVFECAFARPQDDGNDIKLEEAIEQYGGLKDKKQIKLKLAIEPLLDILANARSVYEANSEFRFEAKDEVVHITAASSKGRIEGKVKLLEPCKPVSFKCDQNFFGSLLAKSSGTLTLGVIADECLVVKSKPITYVMSLV